MPAPFSPLLIGADTPPPEEQGYRPTINPLVIPATQTPSLAEGWSAGVNKLADWYRAARDIQLPTVASMRETLKEPEGWRTSGVLPVALRETETPGHPMQDIKLDWGPARNVLTPILDLLEGTGQATSVGGPNAPLAGKVSPAATEFLASNAIGGLARRAEPGVLRAGAGEVSEPKLNRDALGFADRISTRQPSQATDAHSTADYTVGKQAFDEATGPYQARALDAIARHPGVTDKTAEGFITHVMDNLRSLWGAVPDTWKGDAMRWYNGARTLAETMAADFGTSVRAQAASLAALSPQRKWEHNVEQARRVGAIHRDHSDTAWSPEHEAAWTDPEGFGATNPDWQSHFDAIKGKTLSQIANPSEAALWVRLHDRAFAEHNNARIVKPDGTLGDFVLANDGRPEGLQWGTLDNIGNALSVLRDDSLENISSRMGQAHKVRNFYNNIVSPDAGHDITIDTHAGSAGLLRPLGSSSPEIAYALGSSVKPKERGPAGPDQWPSTPANAPSGLKGLYPLYAEAYRRLASELNILPRQLQSVTWEGIRGLYSDVDRRNKPLIKQNGDLWRSVSNGTATAADVRAKILARGIKPPNWHTPAAQ